MEEGLLAIRTPSGSRSGSSSKTTSRTATTATATSTTTPTTTVGSSCRCYCCNDVDDEKPPSQSAAESLKEAQGEEEEHKPSFFCFNFFLISSSSSSSSTSISLCSTICRTEPATECSRRSESGSRPTSGIRLAGKCSSSLIHLPESRFDSFLLTEPHEAVFFPFFGVFLHLSSPLRNAAGACNTIHNAVATGTGSSDGMVLPVCGVRSRRKRSPSSDNI